MPERVAELWKRCCRCGSKPNQQKPTLVTMVGDMFGSVLLAVLPCQDLLEQSPLASQESFDALRRANDQLDEVGIQRE